MPCGASCRWRPSMELSCRRIRARPSWPAASGRPHEWVAHRCITALRTKRRLRNTPTNAERRLAGPAFAPRPARLCHVVTAEWDTTRTKLVARVLRTPTEAAYPRLRSCEGIAYRRGSESMVPTTQQARAASAPSTDDAIDVVVAPVVGREVAWAAALLSDAERQRASRFLFDRDRDRFIVGRARLRQLLAARLGTRPESVELVYGAHG